MFAFILKLLSIARPYRLRLMLGIIMGVFSGLCEPLLIPLITLIADTESLRAFAANALSLKSTPANCAYSSARRHTNNGDGDGDGGGERIC